MAFNNPILPASLQGISTIGQASGGYIVPNTVQPQYTITNSVPNTMKGTVTCDTLILKGTDIALTLEAIHARLAILVPNPDKLEKYQALREAYDNYKVLEALLNDE